MGIEAEDVWNTAAKALQQQVSEAVWSSTFCDIAAVDLVDDILTLSVPSQLLRQRIEQRYVGLVEAVLEDTGHHDLHVVLEVVPGEVPVESPPDPPEEPAVALDLRDTEPNKPPTTRRRVATPSTRSSSAPPTASRTPPPCRWRRRPPRCYNPLFVYGGAGLGKTHLLQAIAHYVRENYPTFRVRYISTETMLNEFVDAIRKNSQPDFKQRYRKVDVLLIDDIQLASTN